MLLPNSRAHAQNITVRGATHISRHPYYAEVHFYAAIPTCSLRERRSHAERTARGGSRLRLASKFTSDLRNAQRLQFCTHQSRLKTCKCVCEGGFFFFARSDAIRKTCLAQTSNTFNEPRSWRPRITFGTNIRAPQMRRMAFWGGEKAELSRLYNGACACR